PCRRWHRISYVGWSLDLGSGGCISSGQWEESFLVGRRFDPMQRQRLANLRPQAYEHPTDKSALDALTHFAALDIVIQKLNAWGFERLLRVQLTGSYLRASRDAFTDIYEILEEACDTLDLPFVPDLYLGGGDELNAFTAGVE